MSLGIRNACAAACCRLVGGPATSPAPPQGALWAKPPGPPSHLTKSLYGCAAQAAGRSSGPGPVYLSPPTPSLHSPHTDAQTHSERSLPLLITNARVGAQPRCVCTPPCCMYLKCSTTPDVQRRLVVAIELGLKALKACRVSKRSSRGKCTNYLERRVYPPPAHSRKTPGGHGRLSEPTPTTNDHCSHKSLKTNFNFVITPYTSISHWRKHTGKVRNRMALIIPPHSFFPCCYKIKKILHQIIQSFSK